MGTDGARGEKGAGRGEERGRSQRESLTQSSGLWRGRTWCIEATWCGREREKKMSPLGRPPSLRPRVRLPLSAARLDEQLNPLALVNFPERSYRPHGPRARGQNAAPPLARSLGVAQLSLRLSLIIGARRTLQLPNSGPSPAHLAAVRRDRRDPRPEDALLEPHHLAPAPVLPPCRARDDVQCPMVSPVTNPPYPGATRHLIPPLLSTSANRQHIPNLASEVPTLDFRLLLPSLVLEDQSLKLLPFGQTLLLISL